MKHFFFHIKKMKQFYLFYYYFTPRCVYIKIHQKNEKKK